MATLVGNLRGPQGQAGATGAEGPEGPEGPQGPQGEPGPEGPAGTGFNMRGTKADMAELEQVQDPAVGDAYFVEDEGVLYAWDGEAWVSMGDIRGPEGPQGPQGDPGTNGQNGAPGAQGDRGTGWFTGAGAPQEPIAGTIAGDLYMNTVNGDVYELAGAA